MHIAQLGSAFKGVGGYVAQQAHLLHQYYCADSHTKETNMLKLNATVILALCCLTNTLDVYDTTKTKVVLNLAPLVTTTPQSITCW